MNSEDTHAPPSAGGAFRPTIPNLHGQNGLRRVRGTLKGEGATYVRLFEMILPPTH